MSQRTLVVIVPRDRFADLKGRFDGGDFELRSVPHAVFSVKGGGAVATLYESGKLVVQASDPELFLARYTDLDAPAADLSTGAAPAGARDEIDDFDVPIVGSDETGKGDYFGPLVVAAVRLTPEEGAELRELGVADSKKLTDERALRLAAFLRTKVPHAIRRMDPPEYNETYPRYKGLNPLLADLHAEAIRQVAVPGVRVLVDQFAHQRVMEKALAGLDVELRQAHRAERNVAVAAASILARAEFLLALAELSEAADIDLHKGAGAPVDRAGVRYAQRHGVEALSKVAKLHFRNTGKIQGRLR